MNVLSAAIRYASLGYRVLPVGSDKRPLNEKGVYGATTDVDTITRWFTKRPNVNLGVATGEASGILVVDVDVRSGGLGTLGALTFEHQLPATSRQVTGSGGEHWLFQMPTLEENVELKGKLGPGVDVLGNGRYFVVAPSTNSEGGSYRWAVSPERQNVHALPEWLLPLVSRQMNRPDPTPRRSLDSQTLMRVKRYLGRIPGAISGANGHAHTFVVASKLVHGFGLDADSAFAVMSEWNQTCNPPWSNRDLRHKINSAVRSSRYSRHL